MERRSLLLTPSPPHLRPAIPVTRERHRRNAESTARKHVSVRRHYVLRGNTARRQGDSKARIVRRLRKQRRAPCPSPRLSSCCHSHLVPRAQYEKDCRLLPLGSVAPARRRHGAPEVCAARAFSGRVRGKIARPSERSRYMLASIAALSGSTLAPEIESMSFPFFHKWKVGSARTP